MRQLLTGKAIGDSVSLLTVFPLSKRELSRERAGHAMLVAPLVGLGIAVIAAMGVALMRFGLDPHSPSLAVTLGWEKAGEPPVTVNPLAAVIGIGIVALVTRGLHLDGLADTVDSLASYKGKEEALAIMRKPDLGPLGMASVVLVLLTQVLALAHCINMHRGTTSLAIAIITGRLAMTLACTPATPAARPEGLGAMVAGTVSKRAALACAAITGLACVAIGFADIHSLGRYAEMIHAAAAVIVGCGLAHLVRRHCVRRLGGITGDVLGALGEIATTVAIVVMAFGA